MDSATILVLALFLNIIKQESPDLLDPKHNPSGIEIDDLLVEYDFIVVGAGAAGSVLGGRLSEVEHWSVLLIESGADETVFTKTPLYQKVYKNRSITWDYWTVYQENACQTSNGYCDYPTGKIMGGSSGINGMLYARGSKYDYDEWEEMGCSGWSFKDVLPYFKKSESVKIPELMDSPYHGTDGPLVVQHAKYLPDIVNLMVDAAQELGIPKRDYNGEYLTGVDIPQLTVNDAQRWSASSAYLAPARKRKNLHILKSSLAKKVLLDAEKKSARGVEVESDGIVKQVYARNEVILSAGAINTPQLLMLSGIGPRGHLESLGIEVVADLPVGENFQDHAQANFTIRMKGDFTVGREKYSSEKEMIDYAKNKNGLYTYNAFPAMVFFSLGEDIAKDPPDIQIHMIDYTRGISNQSTILIIINKTKPESRGTVKLRSSNPKDPPLIDPKYFTDPRDLEDTIKGLNRTLDLLTTQKLSIFEPKIVENPFCSMTSSRREYLECMVKHYSGTVYHPVGTARMGPRGHPDSVVDPDLRVIGIDKLRVIDASIMPKLIRANTNGPTMMIAEKASDIIKQYYNKL